eukprot:CAMPEP_0119028606 /NCGR_PEP_ID=MMETSP1176-20130426/39184_1 /TAXON_ID=265551 /ORGANISM="Synedropsis recta cf, Strain CCMP1620" /LENGTH=392 /DNA_ID=CAMNT_0006984779 /DNA_START=45 /DNA_END=1223 /DNA_ORIENTATION=+
MSMLAIIVTTCTIRPSSAAAWVPTPPPRRRTNASASSSITALAAKKSKKNTKRSTNNKSSGGGFGRTSNKSDDNNAAVLSISPPPTKVTAAAPTYDAKELAVYTKYVKEESSRRQTKKDAAGLVQISSSPLMFTMDNFMNADACTTLTEEDSEAFCLEFRDNVSQLLGGQMGALDGMKFNYASSRDANNDATSEQVSFPDGVHMDTNNDCIFRHLTAILYLNDVPTECGGATLFPLARVFDNDPVLSASKRLLHEKIGHTRSCGVVRKSGVNREADAQLLESRVGSHFLKNPSAEGAIRVQPQAGKLLLFFSRTASGMEDPRSWHGGERLRHAPRDNNESSVGATMEKRILTIFKQVDYGSQQPDLAESSLETYLSHQIQTQSQSLLRLSQL